MTKAKMVTKTLTAFKEHEKVIVLESKEKSYVCRLALQNSVSKQISRRLMIYSIQSYALKWLLIRLCINCADTCCLNLDK